MLDSIIIGTGPAGLSAALNLKIRQKNFLWIGSKSLSDKLEKAEKIDNYPGLPGISGRALAEAFKRQIDEAGLTITEGIVTSVIANGSSYAVIAGSEFYESKTIILATGVGMSRLLPGEAEKLGMGVSYCATCDGGLYRGKTIAVLGGSPRFEEELRFLASLAEKVYYFPLYRVENELPDNAELRLSGIKEIEGSLRVEALRLMDGTLLPVDGLFCLRDSVALGILLPELKTADGHIAVDRRMAANLPGIFAAGDCTGQPYQYARAVGEGNVAAHSVIAYLSGE